MTTNAFPKTKCKAFIKIAAFLVAFQEGRLLSTNVLFPFKTACVLKFILVTTDPSQKTLFPDMIT